MTRSAATALIDPAVGQLERILQRPEMAMLSRDITWSVCPNLPATFEIAKAGLIRISERALVSGTYPAVAVRHALELSWLLETGKVHPAAAALASARTALLFARLDGWIAVPVLITCVLGVWFFFRQLPFTLLPTGDSSTIRGFFIVPEGASPDEQRKLQVQLDPILQANPAVDKYFTVAGRPGRGAGVFTVLFLKPANQRPDIETVAAQLRKAVDWLMERSQRNGLIGIPNNLTEAQRYMYGHGFSVLFLACVYGEEEDGERRKRLEDILTRGVEFIGKAQSTQGGWYYLSAADCGDWYAIGARDGRLGATPQAQSYATRCGVAVDEKRYSDGWRDGYSQRPVPLW